jgi:hypothetical protein
VLARPDYAHAFRSEKDSGRFLNSVFVVGNAFFAPTASFDTLWTHAYLRFIYPSDRNCHPECWPK